MAYRTFDAYGHQDEHRGEERTLPHSSQSGTSVVSVSRLPDAISQDILTKSEDYYKPVLRGRAPSQANGRSGGQPILQRSTGAANFDLAAVIRVRSHIMT